MFSLFIVSNLFVLFSVIYYYYKIYNNYFKINENLKLENNNVGVDSTTIIKIEFYLDNNILVKLFEINKKYYYNNIQKNFDFSYYLFDYDFYLIYYKLDNINQNSQYYNFEYSEQKIYIWKDNNKEFITFPIYDKSELIKYVFINRITSIKIDDNKLECFEKILESYAGPNYNFYIDKNNNITLKKIFDINFVNYNNNSVIKLTDTFNNEFIYDINSILKWEPKLIL